MSPFHANIGRQSIASFTIFFVFFVPGHMLDWAIEWTWLGIQLLVSFFWFIIFRQKVKPTAGVEPETWIFWFLVFTLCGFMGTLYSSVFMGFKVDLKDLHDLFRFLIFIPLALFIGSAIDERNIAWFTLILKATVLFNLITSVILLTDILGLSGLVMMIYGDAKVQYYYSHIRIGIPFTNPNFAALVFFLALAYFASFKKSLTFVVLSSISLLLTGSRSGMLSALPIFLLLYFSFFVKIFSSRIVLAFFIFSHLILFYFVSRLIEISGDFPRISELTDALVAGDISQVDTANIRFEVVGKAIEIIERSPFFGVGPGRSYGLDVTDSQLIAWPLMYGIPCAILISVFFAFIFLNTAVRASSRNYSIGMVAVFFSFFLMLSTGDFMKNYRLFVIAIIFAHIMQLVVVNRTLKNPGHPMPMR